MRGRFGHYAALAILAIGVPACAHADDAGAGKADKSVAAEVGGQKITMQETDDFLRKTNGKAFQDFYDARRAALEQLIAERLMAAEAASKSVTVDKLRQDAVAAVPPVTDADVETFFNQNKARMGAATLEQAREQIRGYVAGQKQQKAMMDLVASLKEKQSVKILLEPPRSEVRIAEDDPSEGPKDAPIQLVEFSDFQ